MNLANPWAFYFLFVALPIVALYLLRIRRRRQMVPSLALWQRVIKENRATALFQKLKRLFSLLLQLLILLLLVFALSRPFTGRGFLREENIVLILDASASMSVREDGGKTRFQMAVDSAKRIIRDRGISDEMMLIRAGTPPLVLQPFTRNTKALLLALEKADAGSAPAYLEESVKLAREVLADRPGRKIMIISDGSAGKAPILASDEDVQYISVGSKTENVGIVTFRARKNMSVMTDFVFARVKNFGAEPASFRIELNVNAVTKQVVPMSLDPGQERVHHFTPVAYPGGALLSLSVSADGGGNWSDAFPDDDKAYAVIPPHDRKKVVLVIPPEEDFYFTQAFSAMPETIDTERSFAISEAKYLELDNVESEADVTIFYRCLPAHPEKGNYIMIDPPAAVPPVEMAGYDNNVTAIDWNRRHPVTRFLSFHHLNLKRAQKIRLSSEAEVLLEGSSGPLMASINHRGKRIVYVAFDMLDTDLPFRVAFPALIRNVLGYFHEVEYSYFRDSYTVGESIQPLRMIPEEAEEVVVDYLHEDRNTRHVLQPEGRKFLYSQTDSPGFYKVSFTGKSYFTVVNLLTMESDIKPSPGGAQIASLSKSAIFLNRDFWMLFAFIGAIVLATEWILFHKRVTE